jgi:hypothetical protein
MDAGRPRCPLGSCAAEPTQPDCPPISVIYYPPEIASEGWTGGAMATAERDSMATAEPDAMAADDGCTERCEDDPEETGYVPVDTKLGPYDICHVKSSQVMLRHDPRRAVGVGRNFCEYGYPVQYTEVYESLYKLSAAHGYWVFKDKDGNSRGGPGSVDVRAESRCGNPNTNYWRGTAFAHTVIAGRGYVGNNRKYNFQDCGG